MFYVDVVVALAVVVAPGGALRDIVSVGVQFVGPPMERGSKNIRSPLKSRAPLANITPAAQHAAIAAACCTFREKVIGSNIVFTSFSNLVILHYIRSRKAAQSLSLHGSHLWMGWIVGSAKINSRFFARPIARCSSLNPTAPVPNDWPFPRAPAAMERLRPGGGPVSMSRLLSETHWSRPGRYCPRSRSR